MKLWDRNEKCCDIFRASICESDCALKKTFETGQPILNKTIFIIDPSGKRIPISISTALLKDSEGNIIGGVETFRDLSAVEQLRQELEKRYSFQDIVSKNKVMLQIFEILPIISQSNSTVLIEGESGTGKELVARAIHNLSDRRDKPMIVVNCGALPDNLLESELFGYKAGAFTGARKDKPGRFDMADGGTIFLDEIADISPALQVRLLRVLQDHIYEPLGATESVKADVRIIAAANQNLGEMVKDGRFREDLYYRINVIKLKLPELNERKEDIPLLIEHFIDRYNKTKSKSIAGVSPDVLTVLMTNNYPGNIRELENIIEHAFVLCQDSIIEIEHLPAYLQLKKKSKTRALASVPDFEKHLITETLKKNNWNRLKTASELGMHKTTLWRKIKKLGIEIPNP